MNAPSAELSQKLAGRDARQHPVLVAPLANGELRVGPQSTRECIPNPARIISWLGMCSDASDGIGQRFQFAREFSLQDYGTFLASDSAARTVARRSGNPRMPPRRARTASAIVFRTASASISRLLGFEFQPAQFCAEDHLDRPRLAEAGAARLGQGVRGRPGRRCGCYRRGGGRRVHVNGLVVEH
jgi:hypothetical protein